MQIFHPISTGQHLCPARVCPFTVLNGVFRGIEFLLHFNLDQFILFFFFMVFTILVTCLKYLYLTEGFKDIPLCFLLENYCFTFLILMYTIHLELCVCVKRYCQDFIFLWVFNCSSTIY